MPTFTQPMFFVEVIFPLLQESTVTPKVECQLCILFFPIDSKSEEETQRSEHSIKASSNPNLYPNPNFSLVAYGSVWMVAWTRWLAATTAQQQRWRLQVSFLCYLDRKAQIATAVSCTWREKESKRSHMELNHRNGGNWNKRAEFDKDVVPSQSLCTDCRK